jgi:hypothetical protein
VSWPSQLWCVDNGNAEELVVTTTMATSANIRRGAAAVAKRGWNCLIWLTLCSEEPLLG